jgi:hypothetical protein
MHWNSTETNVLKQQQILFLLWLKELSTEIKSQNMSLNMWVFKTKFLSQQYISHLLLKRKIKIATLDIPVRF